MLPWVLLPSIFFSFILLFVNALSANSTAGCSCYLEEENTTNSTQELHLLKCDRGVKSQVPCQRINDLIRIGPLETGATLNSINEGLSITNKRKIKVAPWAFADLLADGSVRHLQLDLHLPDYELDALKMGGLENLHNLMARTSIVRWDSCSFMGMTQLTKVLLNCKSVFNEFIAFSHAVRDVRFLNCEDVPLQFYCMRCSQDPRTKVIRILPGPPLRQYMIKFSHFDIENMTKTSTLSNDLKPIPIGQCINNVCSDEMLCRNNEPLKLSQANIGRPTTIEPTTSPINFAEFTETANKQIASASTSRSSTSTSDQSAGKSVVNPSIPSWMNYLSERSRIWITIAIVAVIVLILCTLCILITMTKQRTRKHRVKFTAAKPCPSQTNCNGAVDEPVILTCETKLEAVDLPT